MTRETIIRGYAIQGAECRLDAFFVLNQLHVDTDPRRELLRTIQAEDVTLIGYEWLT